MQADSRAIGIGGVNLDGAVLHNGLPLRRPRERQSGGTLSVEMRELLRVERRLILESASGRGRGFVAGFSDGLENRSELVVLWRKRERPVGRGLFPIGFAGSRGGLNLLPIIANIQNAGV